MRAEGKARQIDEWEEAVETGRYLPNEAFDLDRDRIMGQVSREGGHGRVLTTMPAPIGFGLMRPRVIDDRNRHRRCGLSRQNRPGR